MGDIYYWDTPTQCQNINGTSHGAYPISNLKQKYILYTGTQRHTCCAAGCGRDWQATAHVQVNDGRKNGGTFEWFLVPTCNYHNSQGANPVFDANPSTMFVKVTDLVAAFGH